MFSGLVETVAKVHQVVPEDAGVRILLEKPAEFQDVRIGDSIAIQGCCLTVVDCSDKALGFQAGLETLSRTTLGKLTSSDRVNCERSLKLGDRIGGHLVSGHVDGMGMVQDRTDHSDWSDIVFQAPRDLTIQMASKGSITVDGVSLTLVLVTDNSFSVALIPHTLSNTTLGDLTIGRSVNLETDLLAKYVSQQLKALITTPPGGG